jgi:hypothetical protein
MGRATLFMNLPVTFAMLLASIGLTVFCGWMGARPRDYS